MDMFTITFLMLMYAVFPTLYVRLFYKTKEQSDDIYLTFDDGPSPKHTNDLLDLLAEYNIKATFFVVADFAKSNPDIIKRMQREKHTIGLHSLEHISACLKGYKSMKRDFEQSHKIMKDLGVDIKLYRPPWGHVNIFTPYFIKKYNYSLAMWDVMTEDWSKHSTVDDIKKRLIARTKKGNVVCLHDGRGSCEAPKRTIKALSQAIPQFIDSGYTFSAMG